MELLAEYRKWYREEKFRWGDKWEDNDYLFPRENGAPMFPGYVCNWLTEFSKRHGLPHINPHAFRHTETGEDEAEGSRGLRETLIKNGMRTHLGAHPILFYQYCFTNSLDSFSVN